MKVLLIDDEEHGLELLTYNLENNFSDVTIVGKFQAPIKVIQFINEHPIDIIFLDINMPNINGLEFAELIKSKDIPVIFATAHEEYALDAIKLNAFDYLLKPINLKELSRIYLKIKTHLERKESNDKIRIKISNRYLIFQKHSILFVVSEGNYSTIHFTDRKPLLITKNMKKMMEDFFYELPFVRIHRSYLVNIDHVIAFDTNELTLSNKKEIPIARGKIGLLDQSIIDI